MYTITILTPTYNRAKELIRLWESLKKQTNKQFVWIIVDDGSKDNTEEIVKEWLNHEISITYLKKENGGKHTALNYGIKRIDTDLTFIVDSDDWLSPDAIDSILKVDKKYRNNKLCAYAFLRENSKGEYLTNKLVPKNGLVEDYCTCRIGRNICGDMAEVWYTSCLKEYPFPEFEGEKFLSEDVVWLPMAQKYKMVFFNKAIYKADYLDGGLTKTRRECNIRSPKGNWYRGKLQLQMKMPIKQYIRAMAYYIVYGQFAHISIKELYRDCPKKILFYILYIPNQILFTIWKKKYNKIL